MTRIFKWHLRPVRMLEAVGGVILAAAVFIALALIMFSSAAKGQGRSEDPEIRQVSDRIRSLEIGATEITTVKRDLLNLNEKVADMKNYGESIAVLREQVSDLRSQVDGMSTKMWAIIIAVIGMAIKSILTSLGVRFGKGPEAAD